MPRIQFVHAVANGSTEHLRAAGVEYRYDEGKGNPPTLRQNFVESSAQFQQWGRITDPALAKAEGWQLKPGQVQKSIEKELKPNGYRRASAVLCVVLTPSLECFPESDTLTQAQRRLFVEQARANLRARGVVLSAPVYALYERYLAGDCTRQQILSGVLAYCAARKTSTASQLNSPVL